MKQENDNNFNIIDKNNLDVKDLNEAKYQYLIKLFCQVIFLKV